MQTLKKLEQQIKLKKEEMIQLGMSKGFTHPDTVKCSQQLDKLLNQHMKVKGQ